MDRCGVKLTPRPGSWNTENSTPTSCHNPQLHTRHHDVVTDVRNSAEMLENDTRCRIPLALTELDSKCRLKILGRDQPRHRPNAVTDLNNLVIDCILCNRPHQLLCDVLDRHETGSAAVLVDHHR